MLKEKYSFIKSPKMAGKLLSGQSNGRVFDASIDDIVTIDPELNKRIKRQPTYEDMNSIGTMKIYGSVTNINNPSSYPTSIKDTYLYNDFSTSDATLTHILRINAIIKFGDAYLNALSDYLRQNELPPQVADQLIEQYKYIIEKFWEGRINNYKKEILSSAEYYGEDRIRFLNSGDEEFAILIEENGLNMANIENNPSMKLQSTKSYKANELSKQDKNLPNCTAVMVLPKEINRILSDSLSDEELYQILCEERTDANGNKVQVLPEYLFIGHINKGSGLESNPKYFKNLPRKERKAIINKLTQKLGKQKSQS